jgi:hypothetical protein
MAWRMTGEGAAGMGRDGRDFTFLWRRADHAAVVNRMAAVEIPEFLFHEPLEELFNVRTNTLDDAGLHTRQDEVLDAWIVAGASSRREMERVFQIVAGQAPDRRRDRLATFLGQNTNPEDLAALQLEPRSRGWSGSAVPMYQRDVDFYESLLPLCRGVTFLRQRQFVEQRIAALQETIEHEKRRDFARDVEF